MKRPEGMHREVFALLYNDNKDAPPLLETDTGLGYKQNKARLGMKRVRKWEWAPFTNPARKDSAVFHHWRRVSDEPKEYPFANMGQKKAKALEGLLQEYKQDPNPPPTDEICTAFNELRSDMVLLYELRCSVRGRRKYSSGEKVA